MFQHDLKDLTVGFFHAVLSNLTHTADGFCCFLLQDPGIRRIGLTVHRKMMCQKSSIQAGSDLGSTGDLGSVTDDPRNIGQCILYGFLIWDMLPPTIYVIAAPAAQEADTAPQKAESLPI